MYGQHGNEYSPMEFLPHFSSPDIITTETSYPTPPPPPHPLSIPEYDSISALKSELGYSSSTGYCSNIDSPNSITSYGPYSPTLIQRSTSSHSLHKNLESSYYTLMNTSSPPGFSESDTSSIQKVLSTGDLQGLRPLQHKQSLSSSIADEVSIIEGMNKACKYSPEEKKERIERYRSKKTLRNFNKKIKYECRKTLADSRPRVRGRFMRNDEIERPTQAQLDHAVLEEDDDNWINFLNSFSANLMP